MTDADTEYEMVDAIRFSLPHQMDDDHEQFPRRSKELGYQNPVVFCNTNIKHTYESPVYASDTSERRQGLRARVNEVYEGSDKDLNKTEIFEAIPNIDYGSADEKKKHCQLGCFSVFSLILLSLLSLTASGYIFYKMEIEQSLRRCTCTDAKTRAFSQGKGAGNENKSDKVNTVALTDQLHELEKNIKWLEKKFNKTKVNNSLNSGKNCDHRLQELQNVLDKKMLAFSKNATWMKELLSKTRTLVKNGENLEMELRRMNNTINSEVAKLKNKLAEKGSFKNCTFNMKKKTNIFSQTNYDYILLIEKKSAKHKIVGVTCTSTMNGQIQYSHLEIDKKNGITYKCVCTRRNARKSNFQDECIMYYWQCPNT